MLTHSSKKYHKLLSKGLFPPNSYYTGMKKQNKTKQNKQTKKNEKNPTLNLWSSGTLLLKQRSKKKESQSLVKHMEGLVDVKLLHKQELERKLQLCVLTFWRSVLTFRLQLDLNYSLHK